MSKGFMDRDKIEREIADIEDELFLNGTLSLMQRLTLRLRRDKLYKQLGYTKLGE